MSIRAIRSQPIIRCFWPTQRFQEDKRFQGSVANIGSCPRGDGVLHVSICAMSPFSLCEPAPFFGLMLFPRLALAAVPFIPGCE